MQLISYPLDANAAGVADLHRGFMGLSALVKFWRASALTCI